MQATSFSLTLINSVRRTTLTTVAGGALLVALSTGARAQSYIGNAYDAGAAVGTSLSLSDIASLTVNATAGLNYQGALPSAGGNYSGNLIYLGAGINVVAGPVLTISGSHFATDVVGSASTHGASGVTTSSATIDDVNLLGGLVTADAVTSTTTATYSSSIASGSSAITNLMFGGHSVTITGVPDQTVGIYSTDGLNTLEAQLVIDEQVLGGSNSYLTTNALDLTVYDSALDTIGAQGKVIVASSTAGFTGRSLSAAPEPGAMALLGSIVPGIAGMVAMRRRRAIAAK